MLQHELGILRRPTKRPPITVSRLAAAVSEPWCNGPVEGQVNRLKTIKRQMYGRARGTAPRPTDSALAVERSPCNGNESEPK